MQPEQIFYCKCNTPVQSSMLAKSDEQKQLFEQTVFHLSTAAAPIWPVVTVRSHIRCSLCLNLSNKEAAAGATTSVSGFSQGDSLTQHHVKRLSYFLFHASRSKRIFLTCSQFKKHSLVCYHNEKKATLWTVYPVHSAYLA